MQAQTVRLTLYVDVSALAAAIAPIVAREVANALAAATLSANAAPTAKAQMLTTRQAAELTGIPLKTLERWRAERKGDGPPPVKLTPAKNGAVMYSRADLEAWIESRKVRAT